jgi:hypothetical protein
MKFERSRGSPHHFLAQLVGGWAGTTRTSLEPGGLPSHAKTQGSVQLILEGRFAIYLYQSASEAEAEHGMFIFGYNTTLDQYEASWLDSLHNNTAIMHCVGGHKENGFFVLGTYPATDGGPDWSWRTEVQLIDKDSLNLTAYNMSPEGGEAKAIETVLKRIK